MFEPGTEQLASVQSDEGRYRLKQLPRALGFDKGFYVCVRALQLLVQQNQGCIVVAVAGEHLLLTVCWRVNCVHITEAAPSWPIYELSTQSNTFFSLCMNIFAVCRSLRFWQDNVLRPP